MINRSLNYGRRQLARFLRKLPACRHVLDIGAGRGQDLLLVRQEFPQAKLYAIDYLQTNVEFLRENNISAQCLNIEQNRLPWADGSMDLIILNQVLEHVKEVFWLLHEVTRVLSPGGHLIIGVPNLASLHNRLLLLLGRQPTAIQNSSAHIRGWTLADLTRVLGIGGSYKRLARKGANFYPFPPSIARPLAVLLPGLAWGSMSLWKKHASPGDAFIRYPLEAQLETNFRTAPEIVHHQNLSV